MRILVTVSAGFIGSHLALRLLDRAEPLMLVGIDNLNDYYDPSLKAYRLKTIGQGQWGPPETSSATAGRRKWWEGPERTK